MSKAKGAWRIDLDSENSRYYGGVWLETESGGSGSWQWVARRGLTYIFLDIMDLVDAMGKEAPRYWSGQVSVVDLGSVTVESLRAVLNSHGAIVDDLDFREESARLAIAQMLRGDGVRAPILSEDRGEIRRDRDGDIVEVSKHGRDFRGLRLALRREGERLFSDEVREGELDTKIVNGLGQTAREYAGGIDGLWSALRRARDAGDAATPEQRIALMTYGAVDRTIGGEPVPEDLRRGRGGSAGPGA